MKKIILLIITITQWITSYSQVPPDSRDIRNFKIVDESTIRITYSLNFKLSPNDKEFRNDTRMVQIGKQIIKDYSGIVYTADSIATSNIKKGAANAPTLQEIVFPYDIFNNYESGKTLLTYRTFLNGPVLRYFDIQPVFNWELKEGNQKIMGYNCQPATTHFAGRDYTAWFTMELPINAGPYKFNGLPGIILKVEESNKYFVWTAIGISNIKEPIVLHEFETDQKCTKKQADEIIKNMYTKPYTFINSISNGIMIYVDGQWKKGTSENEAPIPYEPLEK